LYNWSRALLNAKGYSTTTYATYAKHLITATNEQSSAWNLYAASSLGTEKNLRRVRLSGLWNQLQHQHSKMAFALLWVFIDPTSLDNRNGDFPEWTRPRLQIEIDHQGQFRNVSSGEVYYEGGETKSGHTGMYILCFKC
jgi:hypothetical protein